MVNVYKVYKAVEYLVNKDQMGNMFTPEQFNMLSEMCTLDLFKLRMGLPENYVLGAPVSKMSPDLTQKMTDDTRQWKVNMSYPDAQLMLDSYGRATIPSNYLRVDAIRYREPATSICDTDNTPVSVDVVTESQLGDRLFDALKRPTTRNPVCIFYSSTIVFHPANLGSVDFVYFRKPNVAYLKTTINETTDEWEYTPSGSIDFDFPDDMFVDIVRQTLSYVGIHLRSQDIYQYAEQSKAKGN
jgi:hypothetical protein